jgi:hypothetical protein
MSRCGLRSIVKALTPRRKAKWKSIPGTSMEHWVSSKVSGTHIVTVK